MNTKIEELKKKAMVTVRSHGAFGENERYERLDPDLFAKLIIEECFDVVIADGRFHDVKSLIRAGKYTAMEHFGVE